MAMPIGEEYRPAWVQQRHWQRFAEEAKINFALLRKRSLALAKQVQINLDASSALLGMADSNLLAAIEQRVQQRCQWLEGRLGV
ncbi:hypothetical protein SAMN02745130_03271 [Thiothrix eikelboomii]|uniref:Uncharacterized protein n=1 Tax=Thiothrix eikelboomii TaxID=92487 RepID=A0A1T4XP73_9GAMM|nr:hypothetical protein [Thiothrix eikelboomii]SKA91359.1 hypothetical protein SAMN02745130_03271 [Thiothrix eikelboomii]